MIRLLRIAFAAMMVVALPAVAQEGPPSISLTTPLIADISQYTVEIQSDFNGTSLLIFGTRNVAGDLVIAVRGPGTNATLRRKERIAGMWMHVDQRKYFNLPIFYAIASTKPLSRLASPSVLQSLGLGSSRITRASNAVPDEVFDEALEHSFTMKHWWQMPFGTISYFGESLFKARLDLPDTLPSGDYTAEVYLFDHGKLLGFQIIPLTSFQTGFDARVVQIARGRGLLYGLIAIAMALFGGWFAHRLFHR